MPRRNTPIPVGAPARDNDLLDSLRLAMQSPITSTTQAQAAQQAAMTHADLQRAMGMVQQEYPRPDSATAQLMAQRDNRPRVRVEFVTHPEMRPRERANTREIRISTEPMHLAMRHEMEREERIPIQEQHREIASRVARQMADAIYEETLIRLHDAERQYQRDLDRQHGVGGIDRAPRSIWRNINEGIRHGADLARGVVDSARKAIPLKSWFNHKQFELNGWTATLLETEEQIDAEGRDMEHCFATSYKRRIAEETYIGYHITAPQGRGLPRSGFTLGFRVSKTADKQFQYDQVKGKRNQTHHVENPELLAMIEHIDSAINMPRPVQAIDQANVETVEIPREWVQGAVA